MEDVVQELGADDKEANTTAILISNYEGGSYVPRRSRGKMNDLPSLPTAFSAIVGYGSRHFFICNSGNISSTMIQQ